ncbi:hypothetical protein GCM10009546_53050 [Actinomadura livida]|uniref:Uncharacterized protein n=1 Tax=Actinomadura livida TaxID=79909 RepID=A0ABN1F759_9ACTN|nr:hypothetical protein GCM10010208_16910 [Actinomadura livida]
MLPNSSQPKTIVVGGVRYSSAETRVTPVRRTLTQYSPYPPNIATRTSRAAAAQKTGSAGGTSVPSAPARPENRTVATTACTARASGSATAGRARRSTRVAATSASIAPNGSRYAQAGAPPRRSPPTTRATPARPPTNPASCRRVIGSPRSGTATATATSGWRAAIRLLMPAATPWSTAAKTPYR